MKSERQKMLTGELYNPYDPEIRAAFLRCVILDAAKG